MDALDIAKVAHEVNRAYCAAIGDYSQLTWDEAPEWQKSSCVEGVQHALRHPDATPLDMHEAWVQSKLAEGWSFGPIKNANTKQHPCMVPYRELPQEQRVKDYLFIAVVRSLAKM